LQETPFQSLDLRVKNAQEGKVGKISLRGTLHRLNDGISMSQFSHRLLLM
jgi:hypothetical protein